MAKIFSVDSGEHYDCCVCFLLAVIVAYVLAGSTRVVAETCCDISKSMSTVVCVVARVPQSRAATTTRTDGKVRVIRCEIQRVRVAKAKR